MKLLAVGDSFTYGEELNDKSLAWPYLLGNLINYEVTNLGLPGGGNTQIVRKVIEHYQQYDLIVVAWSHFARMEFADEYGIYDTWPGHQGKLFSNELEHRQTLIKYFRKYYNDQYLYSQYLINIILLQSLLKNKRYVMFDSFGNTQLRTSCNLYTSQIDTRYYLGWPKESMMEWTYGCLKGPGGHFLELGHQRVADKINEHIRHLGWVS
jgi:hypothetical protein